MLTVETPYESWRAPLEVLHKELGGNILAVAGCGGDYMMLQWEPDPKGRPGWQIGDRLIANPALPGQPTFEDFTRQFKELCKYNAERTEHYATVCMICAAYFKPGEEWADHLKMEYARLSNEKP